MMPQISHTTSEPPRDRGGAGGARGAGHRVPRRGDHRVGQRVVRDPAAPDRAAADHDHAPLGGHPLPADRDPRRAGLPRRRTRPPGDQRRRGDRRSRCPLLRRHDADLRPAAWPASAHDPGPGAHPAPLLVLGEPRLAGPGRHRPAAHRGAPQRGRRPRSRARLPRSTSIRCPTPRRCNERSTGPTGTTSRSTWFDALADPRQGEPLVADIPRGHDRRTPAAHHRGDASAGVRRARARRGRGRMAVREHPVAGPGPDGPCRRGRGHAPGAPRSESPAGGRCAGLLARGGGAPARDCSACEPR